MNPLSLRQLSKDTVLNRVDESDGRAAPAESGTASEELKLNFFFHQNYIFQGAILRFGREGSITPTTCTDSESTR